MHSVQKLLTEFHKKSIFINSTTKIPGQPKMAPDLNVVYLESKMMQRYFLRGPRHEFWSWWRSTTRSQTVSTLLSLDTLDLNDDGVCISELFPINNTSITRIEKVLILISWLHQAFEDDFEMRASGTPHRTRFVYQKACYVIQCNTPGPSHTNHACHSWENGSIYCFFSLTMIPSSQSCCHCTTSSYGIRWVHNRTLMLQLYP